MLKIRIKVVLLKNSCIFDKENYNKQNIMKSLLFKTAWNIFRMTEVSFSEALVLAWSKIKTGLKAVIVKSNKLIKSAGLGYETIYFNELVFTNIETPKSLCDNSAASKWYDGKTFNND